MSDNEMALIVIMSRGNRSRLGGQYSPSKTFIFYGGMRKIC
jgi:hypothetical protein